MRPTKVTSVIALAAFGLSFGAPGCGAGSSSGQALAALAPRATMDWATAALGSAPKSFHALHLAVQPNLQGNWATTRGIVDSAKAAMEGCGQIDVYDDEALIVLHDVPPGIDPARPLRSPYPDFTFLSQAPSGLRLYARAHPNRDVDAVPVLLVTPATWFLGDRLVLSRLTLSLTSSTRVPYLSARAGSIADTFISGAAPPHWIPFADQAVGGGVVMYPFPPNAPAPVAVKVVYASSSGASAAAADLRRLWQAGMLPSANQPVRDRTMDDFLAHVSAIRDEGATLLVQSNVGPDTAEDFSSRL